MGTLVLRTDPAAAPREDTRGADLAIASETTTLSETVRSLYEGANADLKGVEVSNGTLVLVAPPVYNL
jgi:hypothetical protein